LEAATLHALWIVSVWLHIVSVTIWLGGSLFFALVIVPVLRRPEYREAAGQLVQTAGMRFRAVGWICLGVIVATGLFNLNYKGYDWSYLWSGLLFKGPQGRALAVKLGLVVGVFAISLVHDWYLGPKASERMLADPTSAEARALRRTASWMGRANVLLGLAIVAMAVMFVRGGF
jgi:copper resistance protein D